jgi:hypothetical protein
MVRTTMRRDQQDKNYVKRQNWRSLRALEPEPRLAMATNQTLVKTGEKTHQTGKLALL